MVIVKDRRSVIRRQALQRQGRALPPATSNPGLRLHSRGLADEEISRPPRQPPPPRGPSAVSLLCVTL